MPLRHAPFAWLGPALVLAFGCGSDPVKSSDPPAPSGPTPEEIAGALGDGDGSPGSVGLTTIFEPSDNGDTVLQPTGMAWHGLARAELWVTLRDEPSDILCTEATVPCPWLEGHVAILTDADGADPAVAVKIDGNSWHFMRRPTGIAWGAGELFATCGEARTGNFEDEEIPYNGPTLWDADPAIFAAVPKPGMNGTHVDMLHSSPFCMGIAHETANVYWVFNGDAGSLDRYDFHEPHEPGGENHADGELWRYLDGELLRVPEVPGHLVYDPGSSTLYAADPGHSRVIALDTKSGSADGDVISYDNLGTHLRMSGARFRDAITPGTVELPSGIAVVGGVLFVADRASGLIGAYELSTRRLIKSLDTGLGPDALTALSYGPDQKLYFTDAVGGRVVRIEP